MKRKLMVATALIVLLAVSMTLFVGCDGIIERNVERDMTQIVAEVSYGGMTAYVYKYELSSSFNNYSYYYANYYGMGYEEIADYLVQSLAQQKLLVLFAKDEVAKRMGLEKVPADWTELLSDVEKNKAVKDANESLLSSLKDIVSGLISDDKYNSGVTDEDTTPDEEEDDDAEITNPVNIRFEANKGSEVEGQRIQKGKKIKEPDDPTRDGYTFYGWYNNVDCDGAEYDFNTPVPADYEGNTFRLYAKWVKYVAPRTAMPEEEEEEEEFDPDAEQLDPADKVEPFFSTAYYQTIVDELKEDDLFDEIEPEDGQDAEQVLRTYIDEGISTMKTNLKNNLYKDTDEQAWAYYLESQYESLIVDKLERLVGKDVTVSKEEIEEAFALAVAQNRKTFTDSEASYSSALTSSLATTYFHPEMADGSYGFVINILLKLDEDSLKELTDLVGKGPSTADGAGSAEYLVQRRNQLLSQMQITVSNPKYKAGEPVLDENGDEIELRDPMTDPKNPYNKEGKDGGNYDKSYEYKVSGEGADAVYQNNYNNLVTFTKDEDDKYVIQFNASEHPSMAYLLEKVPAFGEHGIIKQIYDSFEAINAAPDLTVVQKVYWLRQMATKWAYLVGDDSGAVTSSSNNNGLGYLITPEGQESSYLSDFTDYARTLVKKGTGSYTALEEGHTATADDFAGTVLSDGSLKGDKQLFVAADSFIEGRNTTNAYAGVFVLLNSYTVWDDAFYNKYTTEEGEGKHLDAASGVLPLEDFISTFAAEKDDIKTIYQLLEDSLTEAKKTKAYNALVNKMGLENVDKIVYYKKVYRSIWKSLT